MRLILASLDSVASAADRIPKEAQNKLPPWGFEISNPDLSQQPGSTRLSKLLHQTPQPSKPMNAQILNIVLNIDDDNVNQNLK